MLGAEDDVICVIQGRRHERDPVDFQVALNRHSIEDHVKTMHTGGRPFQCGMCGYTSVEEVSRVLLPMDGCLLANLNPSLSIAPVESSRTRLHQTPGDAVPASDHLRLAQQTLPLHPRTVPRYRR